jgi:hypothetical protein
MASLLKWADVAPVPQNDGPDPVASIRYNSEYVELMDLFRAVMKAKEFSVRALELTADRKLLFFFNCFLPSFFFFCALETFFFIFFTFLL